MTRFELALGLLTLALWICCRVDVTSRSDGGVRNLPKMWWLLLVLFFPLAGSLAYLVAGRPQRAPRRAPRERAVPELPEYDGPGRAASTKPENDEEFLTEGARARRGAPADPPGGPARAGAEAHARMQRRLKKDEPDEGCAVEIEPAGRIGP